MNYKNLLLIIIFFSFLFLIFTGVKYRVAKNNHKNIIEDTVVKSAVPHTFKLKLNTKGLEWYERDHKLVDLKEKNRKEKEQKLLVAWFKQDKKQREKDQNKDKRSKKSNRIIKNVLLTSYTSHCPGCTGKTATGVEVSHTIYYNGMRVIAVDPSIIDLYSIVKIMYPSGKRIKAIALDTGGKINGKHCDLLVKTKNKALKNGKKHVTIKVLRNGK